MTDEENVTKDALDMLAKMGYEINEYDRGFIACILTQSKRKDSETDSDEHPESDSSLKTE